MTTLVTKNHVNLVETSRNGRITYRLLSSDESLCDFFDNFAYVLAGRLKFKTVKTYCYAIRSFLDYIAEITKQKGMLDVFIMQNALDAYESFLAFGDQSESELASEVAKVIGSKNLSGASIQTHFAAVNNFIDASETLRIGFQELELSGYIATKVASSLPITTSKYVSTPAKIKAAIKVNSWLAGCVSGGARKIKRAGLSPKSRPSTLAHTDEFGGDEMAFPIDKCVALIQSTNCLRDKVLWSLIAASGCRISEALSMLIDDIRIDPKNPVKNKVLIIDPATRQSKLIKYISAADIAKLPHKGRTTEETYLIEPFASLFWRNLDAYIKDERSKERIKHRLITHRFLVRSLTTGNPMPLSYQSVWERFNKAAIVITGVSYGFHSLRHMYAYYLLNHCPNPNSPNKFGLDLKQVQMFLGHRLIETTRRYARQDARMLETTLSAINMLRMRDPFFSITNVRIKHLENELKQLKLSLGKDKYND